MYSFGILGQKSKMSFPLNWSVDRAGFFWSFQGTLFTRLFELPEATRIPWFITLSSHYSICRVCDHIYFHQISLCLTLIGTLVIIFKVQLISLSQDIFHISHEHYCPSSCLNTCSQFYVVYTQKWNRWVLCQFYVKLFEVPPHCFPQWFLQKHMRVWIPYIFINTCYFLVFCLL